MSFSSRFCPRLKTRFLTFGWALAVALPGLASTTPAALSEPSAEKLPRWRGFNLLEKFYHKGEHLPFVEDDFKLISKLGFNFVRLPMDYRGWIRDKDWEQFDEEALRQIDQAVEWGRKYGIHVCINFHRAPGYTVAKPPEPRDLWTDAEAQRVCALHWGTFAKRYRGIPNARLSFNLLNEPGDIDRTAFVSVMRSLVEAIRAEDPQRLIICDTLKWGQTPVEELRELGVASATRGYTPMEISHYRASWVHSTGFPDPAWPRALGPSGLLAGSMKKDISHPLMIEGPFPQAVTLRLRVGVVSSAAHLVVEAGEKRLFEKSFKCGPGQGEWKEAIFKPQWNTHQNLYDRDYLVQVPANTARVSVRVLEGDWLHLSEIGVQSGNEEATVQLGHVFGEKPEPIQWTRDSSGRPFLGKPQGREWLWEHCIKPWKAVEASGVGVIVGEWGAFNHTPHDVTLRWAEDCLRNWQQAGWGWALWNFRGPFGILDSERTDVAYEDFHGHKIDRELLKLLQRY